MDLAAQLVSFLVPQLPYLLDAKHLPAAADRISLEQAKQIWQTLTPEIQARNVLQTAVAKLAATPTATDWQKILHLQLQEIFATRPDIVAQIQAIWPAETGNGSGRTGFPSISVNGKRNQVIGSVTGQARVLGNIDGPVDASQDKTSAAGDGQIAGGNASRSGSNLFSNNTVMLVLIVILALGGAAWMLATRLGPKGVEIETQGGEQTESPSK